jgi:hypothetical protein
MLPSGLLIELGGAAHPAPIRPTALTAAAAGEVAIPGEWDRRWRRASRRVLAHAVARPGKVIGPYRRAGGVGGAAGHGADRALVTVPDGLAGLG